MTIFETAREFLKRSMTLNVKERIDVIKIGI